MLPYVLAMRPAMGLFSVLLCLSAFQLQGRSLIGGQSSHELLIVVAISFLACSGTMLYNDYYDRHRDAIKGKMLALQNEANFFRFAQAILISVGVLASLLEPINWPWFAVTLVMICVAVYYGKSYRYPCLSTIVVAFTASSPAFYAVLKDANRWADGLALIVLAMSAIFAREVLKDIEDIVGDRGHKQTLPVVCGPRTARKIAAAVMVFGALGGIALSADWRLIAISLVHSGCSVFVWREGYAPKIGKRAIDTTIVTLFILLLLAGGPGPNIC